MRLRYFSVRSLTRRHKTFKDEFFKMNVVKPFMRNEIMAMSKYQMHVDGNAASWGLAQKLYSGSAVCALNQSHGREGVLGGEHTRISRVLLHSSETI